MTPFRTSITEGRSSLPGGPGDGGPVGALDAGSAAGSEAGVPGFGLDDADPDVRRRAAVAWGGSSAGWRALLARVPVEQDVTVREVLCTQLARHDRPEVVEALVGLLTSEDAALRTSVVQVLSATARATAAAVPVLLEHPDPEVRTLTVMVLASLRRPEVEGWLTLLACEDENVTVVAAALGELMALAGEQGAAVARRALARFPDDPFIAFAAGRGGVVGSGSSS